MERLALKISGAEPKNKVNQSMEGVRDEGENREDSIPESKAEAAGGKQKRRVAFVRLDFKSSRLRHEKWLLGVK